MDGVKAITNDNLLECLSLIRVGFKMSMSRIERLHDFILTTNISRGVFGYAFYSSGSLVGAILTPYQGIIGKHSIVSLASFYMLPSFRGYRALSFLKSVINLSSAEYDIITNYTPSKSVIKILEAFGFQRMQFTSLRPDCIQMLRSFPTFVIRNLFGKRFYIKAFNVNHAKYYQNLESLQPISEGKVIHFEIVGSIDPLPIKLSVISSNFKGIVPFFRILWSSNPEFVCNNWSQIQCAFFVSMRKLVFADIPGSIDFPCNHKIRLLDFYAYGTNLSGLSICSLGSELMILD